MSQARELADRVVLATRRIGGARDAMLVAAAVLALLAVVEAGGRGDQTGMDLGTALLLSLWATLPLMFLTAHPVAVALAITIANAIILGGSEPPFSAGVLAELLALYWLGRTRSRKIAFPFLLPFVLYALGRPDPGFTLLLLLTAGAVLLGAAIRDRGKAVASAAASRATADTLLEHAARGERARIARELHDVVAHHISMIAVQAETARLTTPGMPPDGAKRLLAIGDTARTALTEMRRLLGVLREDVSPLDSGPVRAPQPGLAELNALVDEARASGGAGTRLIVQGKVMPLDPGVQLTAYRIVQEALTNARRHAPGAAVDVELDYTASALLVRVRDNGPGPESSGDGHGLLGMRERAAMVGGTLTVGRSPGGGFLVETVLPIPADETGLLPGGGAVTPAEEP
ncbi:sensor histidine kinase [Kribbella caucasensis]|uniref:sensor histidine kinase n=1 Tax=Kribbella caucasensis TaxID=2512215 RepID=UPI00192DB2F8|nr:sensor histidine kinase [Kribbella sp. VKM Ac-2527]